jgi:putative membrane protein
MSTIATTFAQMDPRYRDHMDGRHGRWWLGVLLLLVVVAVIAAVVWAIVAATRANRSSATAAAGPSTAAPSAARAILDERFARGEIDATEYAARKQVLEQP